MNIPRLEPTRQFIDRLVLLNRFHAPDEEDYSGAHHTLGLIHREFPDVPVHEQAAYLVARLSTDRPFGQANFRTAWDYVADLLAHRGYDLRASHAEAQELGNHVWGLDQRSPDGEPTGERDPEELMADLAAWFRPRIHTLHVPGRQP